MKKIFIILSIISLITIYSCTNEKTIIKTQPETLDVNLYFVALEDKGIKGEKIGCDDSLVPIKVQIDKSDRIEIEIVYALEKLFSKTKNLYQSQSLYNSLSNFDMKVENVIIGNKQVTVSLVGQYSVSGVCEIPRIENQLKKTVAQFGEFKDITILINGKKMEDVFSSK
ncbi:MAG: hypothetical protein UR28_C0019G0022 [Candidatus Peregrinibacteria bacterium GW2011_GWF2_33_10]|nr:MAG: hypothetical protein UR28_C0019G0022 [Candidatus Peregrinibacteria bacterium GW2011_GWF2_33_10]OGJ43985.1 MAG: hypothetical protein A2272_05125 [Candidatus Peregrinibacteria bacterium RIFOXYA12_FULL_33_12]OGJ45517.1 MAG: hypothetical protein A2263_05960 [Candidatus Peregrinibacteria bacterium RIFOXYA2_FULL_33_21]OGJ50008.1 MAG: hypothetical protein A2307_04540 [Candidatus Peregrinibacteria bacterium RIFOXYB2_FULL_33_20]